MKNHKNAFLIRLIEANNIITKVKVLKVVCLILFLIIEPINKPKIHNGTKDKDNEKVYLLKIPEYK